MSAGRGLWRDGQGVWPTTPSNRYQPLRELGSGSMGTVLLVDDGLRQQQVALKRVLRVDASALIRFKQEFRVVKRLVHPNLVRLYDLDEDPHGVFYTMEFVDGWDLLTYCWGGETLPGPHDPPSAPPYQGPTMPLTGYGGALARRVPPPSPVDPGGGSSADEPAVLRSPVSLPCTLERLAHVLPQCLESLAFLHGHGFVHRDLKPSNVMVNQEGTVKLLDFGLLSRVDGLDGQVEATEIAGTPGYIAPEQFTGGQPSPEGDLYALGAMLFEILAGRPVFVAPSVVGVIWKHVHRAPPALSYLVPEVPTVLAEMVIALLAKNPVARPSLVDLARTLLPVLGARAIRFAPPRAPLPEMHGRAAEQEALRSWVSSMLPADNFGVQVLEGPTGVGKTALAESLANECQGLGLVVLRGCGRSSERVPFNAVDGAIDDLARVLGQRRDLQERSEMQAAAAVASAVFPVLTLGTKPDRSARPEATRRGAFAAVSRLLHGVASDSEGVLILLDDLQWADGDSLAFLESLLDGAPRGVLLVATLRDDVGDNPAHRLVERRAEISRFQVRPLATQAIWQILCAQAGDIDPARHDRELGDVVASCQGRPFLAELAGRAIASRGQPGEVPTAWSPGSLIAELDARARLVLASLVAADEWCRAGELTELLGANPGELEDYLTDLASSGLVRRAGPSGPEGRVHISHDTVRAALLEVLTPAELTDAHRAHAAVLLRTPEASPHRLVRHLKAASDPRAAARHARAAAELAEQQRAYGLAAELYEVALADPGDDRVALLRARAVALERSADYLAAARCWREMRAASEGEDRLDAGLGEAHALLASNRIVEGHERLRSVMAETGEPVGGALANLAAGVAFLLGPRSPSAVRHAPGGARGPELERARAERDIRIGMMVGYFDNLAGVRLLRRARKRLARAGFVDQVAWCDLVFAFFAHNGSAARADVPLARRYTENARALLQRQENADIVLCTWPRFLDGVVMHRQGRWEEAREIFDEALVTLDNEGLSGTFEHLFVLTFRTMLEASTQQVDAFDRTLQRFRSEVRETGDTAIRAHLTIAQMFNEYVHGRFEEGRLLLEELQASFPPSPPTLQRLIADVYVHAPDIYLTDGREARRQLQQVFRQWRRFRPFNQLTSGLMAGIAALNEANALRSGDPDARARRVRWLASVVDGSPPLAASWGWRARAYAADARGRPEQALSYLVEAESVASHFGQGVDLAIARYQRGRRLGGSAGATLVAGAEELIRQTGASERLLQDDAGNR